MLDDALDRREAGAPGDEHDRLAAFLAQIEAAVRAFETQDVAFLHAVEHMLRELPARRQAHMKLQQFVVVGSVGQGEGAAPAVLEQELDVLPGQELQSLVDRQL